MSRWKLSVERITEKWWYFGSELVVGEPKFEISILIGSRSKNLKVFAVLFCVSLIRSQKKRSYNFGKQRTSIEFGPPQVNVITIDSISSTTTNHHYTFENTNLCVLTSKKKRMNPKTSNQTEVCSGCLQSLIPYDIILLHITLFIDNFKWKLIFHVRPEQLKRNCIIEMRIQNQQHQQM